MARATGVNIGLTPRGLYPPKECSWTGMFNQQEKADLYSSLYFADLISSTAALILLSARTKLNMYNHVFEMTYNNFTALWMAMAMRSLVTFILSFFTHMGAWFQPCEINAFGSTFLIVFEVEMLTHACIERYVVAKYITKGWCINKQHYLMYFGLCLFFALMYSAPTYYMGLGRYAYDFTCDTCTFDMVLPNSWKKFLIVIIYLLRSVKPAILMVAMLFWTRRMENALTPRLQTLANVNFTKVINYLVLVNLVLWTPVALLRGWIIWSQLYSEYIYTPSYFSTALRWAMVAYHSSPGASAVLIFVLDRHFPFESYNPTDTYHIPEILAKQPAEKEPDHQHKE